MRNLIFPEKSFKFFVSSDMSSAYSNIFRTDVFRAIVLATDILEVVDWRRDLAIKLSELVLSTNFIEASVGIFKLVDCLPMGSSASQYCLNIVGVVHEIELFEGIPARKEMNVAVDENFEINITVCTEESQVNHMDENEMKALKLFKRYIDDTETVFSSENLTSARHFIEKILKTYPAHLTMNATLSLICFSQLDCIGHLAFSENKLETMLRRNFSAPVNVVPSTSNCPVTNKYCIILSELLRYRRICSDDKKVKLNEDLLIGELIKAGYGKNYLRNQFNKATNHILNNYDGETFVKKMTGENFEDQLFCGKITFDKFSGSHKVVKTLLCGFKSLKFKPVLVPGYKTKTYLISRRKHLKRLREFINHV